MSDYPAGTTLGAWPVTIGGLELDRVDGDSVEWSLTGFSGWGTSSSSGETVDRSGAHGAWAPDWTMRGKEYVLSGSVDAETPAQRWAAEQRMQAAITEADTLMIVHEETPRQTIVRLNGKLEIERTSVYTFDFEAPLLALDPRRYGADARSASTAAPSTSGGLVWPATWPVTWDAVTVSGEMQMPNDGTTDAWPVFRIDGPVSSPSITNINTGEQMRIEIDLAAGDWITVDTERHLVLGRGQDAALRRDKFRGTWWGVGPGTTTVRFDGSPAAPAATLSATWRDTYK